MKCCSNCGNKLAEDAKFCDKCGAKTQKKEKQISNSSKKINWKTIPLVLGGIFAFIFLFNFSRGFVDGFTSAFKDDIRVEVELGVYGERYENMSRTYEVKEGTKLDALVTEKYNVRENEKGIIYSINGIKADDNQDEAWMFYINNDTPQVDWNDYIVRDGDLISLNLEYRY